MLSATCAAWVIGPPLIATGALLELRGLPTPYMHSWLCYGSFRTAESNEPCRGMSAPARIRSEVDQPVEGSLAENRDTQNSVRIFHRQTAECDSDLSIHALRKGVVYSHRPLFQFADGARSGVPAPSQSDSATLCAEQRVDQEG
jgi:hypothetical protein